MNNFTKSHKQQFLRFLKHLNLYEIYVENLKNSKHKKENVEKFVFNDEVPPSKYLDKSFYWDGTKQKHYFWTIVNAIWVVHFCKENINASVGYKYASPQMQNTINRKVEEFAKNGYSTLIL